MLSHLRSKNICLARNTLKFFVDKRLCEPPDSDHYLNVKAPIQKNEAKTFAFFVWSRATYQWQANHYQSGHEHSTKTHNSL